MFVQQLNLMIFIFEIRALNSLEIAQVLLDYILLWTKDSVDRGNIEKFIKLICAEIEICRQHDAL